MPGQDGFAVIQRLMERNREGTAAAEKQDSEKRDSEKRGATSAASAGKQAAALPHFVFATAYDQYAVRAFDVNAVDYLLKPFDRARVLEAVERVRVRLAAGGSPGAAAPDAESQAETQIERLLRLLNRPQAAEPGRAPAKLIVQAQSRLLLVDQAEICFAAIDEGVIRVVTRAFEGQSKCRTLEELMELLDPARFWRAHRGFVVNIDQIREVMPWFKSSYQLRMNDKQQTEIPVSRAQTKRLRELFNL
jgi:two-component system LytT family response regulator/two-component system response regulator LytT